MIRYIVKKTKNDRDGLPPNQVTLKNGVAGEGFVFTAESLLCPDQQLESLLTEDPCRIAEYIYPVVTQKKEKSKNKGGQK